jgi:hypothetical protein
MEEQAGAQFPCRCSGLCERELPPELVLYDPERDRAFLLNHVAALILNLCDGETSAAEIATALTSRFEVAADRVSEDVQTILGQLAMQGLVSWRRRGP